MTPLPAPGNNANVLCNKSRLRIENEWLISFAEIIDYGDISCIKTEPDEQKECYGSR